MNNPGLQHLAENIFWNLHVEDLKICAQINQSCKQILQIPIFCLRKFKYLSEENRKHWIKVIQSVKDSGKGIAIISYLQWNLKKDDLADLPCFTSSTVQDEFMETIRKICHNKELLDEDVEVVKILAPLTNNLNAQNEYGQTPIHFAAFIGHTEIVKTLASFTDNPNAPDKDGRTPIYLAAFKGHTEIVKILAPLTDNPNAPNKNGITPIHCAALKGYTEIVKILAPLKKTLMPLIRKDLYFFIN